MCYHKVQVYWKSSIIFSLMCLLSATFVGKVPSHPHLCTLSKGLPCKVGRMVMDIFSIDSTPWVILEPSTLGSVGWSVVIGRVLCATSQIRAPVYLVSYLLSVPFTLKSFLSYSHELFFNQVNFLSLEMSRIRKKGLAYLKNFIASWWILDGMY